MTNTFNEYLKGATTPPPPPLKTTSTEYQDLKNNSNLTTEQYVNFDENMDRLNTILSRVEALVGLAKENPAVLIECSNLMRAAADIDLPPEIKNHKIATYPSVVQEMYKQVANASPSNAVAQAVKQDNINMQIQQNLSEMRYGSLSYVQPLDAISSALNSNQPVTTEMICKHCQNMSIMNNSELNDLDYCDKLMTAFMAARTPEERAIVDAKMREMAAHAKKRWGERKVWHGSTRQLLNSDRDISAEDMKRIENSLRAEEKIAKEMLRKAKELEEIAKRETDPEQRKRYLELAAHLKKGGYEILAENRATMQAFNRRVRGRDNSNETTHETRTSKPEKINQYQEDNVQNIQRKNSSGGNTQTKLIDRYLESSTPEETQQILEQMQKNAQSNNAKRKNWHKSLNTHFDSGIDVTREQQQTIQSSLKEEEKVVENMFKKADELRKIAEQETDPIQRQRYMELASHIERQGFEVLTQNTNSQMAYNRTFNKPKESVVSNDKTNKPLTLNLNKKTNEPFYVLDDNIKDNKPLTLNLSDKDSGSYTLSIFQSDFQKSTDANRKKWHEESRKILSSNESLSTDELKKYDENLRKEETGAQSFLKTAEEFKALAEKETDPKKRADLLNLSDSLETKAYGILFDNQSSRLVYNQKTNAYAQTDNSNQSVTQKPTEEKTVSGNQTGEGNSAVNQAEPKTPSKTAETTKTEQPKDGKSNDKKDEKATNNDMSSKQENQPETSQVSPQSQEAPLTLKLNRFGQNVIFLDEEKDNLQNNWHDYSAYGI